MAGFYRYLVLIGGLLLLLVCQTGFAADAEKESALVFRVFALSNVKPGGIKVETGPDKVETIEFQSYRRSVAYEYRGLQPLVFFRETIGLDNVITRYPIATVNASDGMAESLLIFVPTTSSMQDQGEFTVFPLDDSITSFSSNRLIVFNATSVELIGRVGEENTRFAPGYSKVFDIRDYYIAEEDLIRVPVGFARVTKEGPQIAFTNTFDFHPEQRVILIIQPPSRPGSHRIRVNKLTDTFPPPPIDADN